ncbi:MAG: PAS domain-containing protein [Alphaproteobacteria bacterium]|nr:PAS domain-containing protein [Alphaproteobacteria bacterium]TAD90187.1 MAG: PAS domain-containing protein [Alphaproteobacteria bacterium]
MSQFFRHNLRHPSIQTLFDFWDIERKGQTMPRQKALNSAALMPWSENLTIIKVQERRNFTYGFYGIGLKQAFGVDMTGADVATLPPEQAAVLRSEYRSVVNNSKPTWRIHTAWFGEQMQTWERIVLPLANDRGGVGLLLIGAYKLD